MQRGTDKVDTRGQGAFILSRSFRADVLDGSFGVEMLNVIDSYIVVENNKFRVEDCVCYF